MTITLATPKDCGDLDPGTEQYAEVKILQTTIDLRQKVVTLRVGFGNTVNGEWKASPIMGELSYAVKGEAYQTLMAALPTENGGSLYEQVAKTLYQWLIDNTVHMGTIT